MESAKSGVVPTISGVSGNEDIASLGSSLALQTARPFLHFNKPSVRRAGPHESGNFP